jgi:hypothetical protein
MEEFPATWVVKPKFLIAIGSNVNMKITLPTATRIVFIATSGALVWRFDAYY